ncbi:uncharacterized protein [Haliotis asinina]|uniref:uncharacterized protein n=1 Tax=Haliotis asinina TaxID=109174 RepID=UPI003531BD2B
MASKPMTSQRSGICLMPPTPCQWEGLFTALKRDKSLQAELWLRENMSTFYGDHIAAQWQVLLEFLSYQVVSRGCEKLVLSSVYSSLPADLQRNILAVIYQHRADIKMEVLRQFVLEMKAHDTTMSWTTLLWQLLAEHVGLLHTVNHLGEEGAAQSEILCRLCKDSLLPSHHAYLLRTFVRQTEALTEPAITLLHVAMDTKPDEEDSTVILDCLSQSADQFHSNLKFGKLLLSFVNKYGKQWTPLQVATMGHICGHHKTFLQKTISSTLKRLTR